MIELYKVCIKSQSPASSLFAKRHRPYWSPTVPHNLWYHVEWLRPPLKGQFAVAQKRKPTDHWQATESGNLDCYGFIHTKLPISVLVPFRRQAAPAAALRSICFDTAELWSVTLAAAPFVCSSLILVNNQDGIHHAAAYQTGNLMEMNWDSVVNTIRYLCCSF